MPYAQVYSGQWQHVLQHVRDAIELNPVFLGWYLYLWAAAQYFSGQISESLVTQQSVAPGLLAGRVLRVAALSGVLRTDKARSEVATILRDQPLFFLERYAAQRTAYLQVLSGAGLPE